MLKTEARRLASLLVVAAIIQSLTVVWGIDLCDTGYYMTFYDNLADNQQSVGHNFMYYLSGVVGSWFLTLFPDSGIVGIRILGLLFNLVTVAAVYFMSRRTVRYSYIMLSTVAVMCAYWSMPMAFYNDILSVALIAVSLALMLRGIGRDKALPIAAGGIIMGVNVYSRVPNILDIVFVGVVTAGYLMHRRGTRATLTASLVFMGGFLGGMAAVAALMALAGHLPTFVDTMTLLRSTAADSSQSHGIANLVTALVRTWAKVGVLAVKLIIVALPVIACRVISAGPRAVAVAGIISLCAAAYVILLSPPVFTLAAIALIGCIAGIVDRRSDAGRRLLAIASLAVIVIMPAGSDGGMTNTGSILILPALPVALASIASARIATEPIGRRVPLWGMVLVTAASVVTMLRSGVYFDPTTPLTASVRTIDLPRARGIVTSTGRAELIERLTAMAGRHVEPRRELLVWGSAPMINYLADRRPFGRCSWPELLSPSALDTMLAGAREDCLPAVMVQRFNTIGAVEWRADSDYASGATNVGTIHTAGKTEQMQRFLTEHGYTAVDSIDEAILYLPPGVGVGR